MCGLGCMVERENEYDNASELDLSATSSPMKLRGKEPTLQGRQTARPMDLRANSPLSLGSMDQNLSMNGGYQGRYHPGQAAGPHPHFMDRKPNSPYRYQGMPDDCALIGGDSVVTVINLCRAHSPHRI